LGQLLEGGPAQVAIQEKGHHGLSQVSERHLRLQQRLKGRAQDHQLIDQMADLQALVIIFRRLPVDPRLLVLQGVAMMLLAIEAFVLYFPAQAPGAAEQHDGGCGQRQISQVDEAATGWFTAVEGGERLQAFQPLEPMTVIVKVADPAKILFDPGLALEAALTAVLARAPRQQRPYLLPDAGQVAVFEGQDKGPAVRLADLKKALVGIEAIGGQRESANADRAA
jgi:hypothetical protein